jgi:hypothetical protein
VINKFTGFVRDRKVDILCNAAVGRDVSVSELRELFDVVRFPPLMMMRAVRDLGGVEAWGVCVTTWAAAEAPPETVCASLSVPA